MTRTTRDRYLGAVALPFDDKTRVVPYDEYVRFILPTLDLNATVREWQAGTAAHVTPGGAVVSIDLPPVPPGFQDTYTDLTLQCTAAATWFIFREIPRIPGGFEQMISRVTLLAAAVRNLIRSSFTGDAAAASYAGDRPLVLGPGQQISMRSQAVIAVGATVTVTFCRYREVGPVIRDTENAAADIVFS